MSPASRGLRAMNLLFGVAFSRPLTPAIHGCHTQAKNLDTLMKRVREVIQLCLEEQNGDATSLELVGI